MYAFSSSAVRSKARQTQFVLASCLTLFLAMFAAALGATPVQAAKTKYAGKGEYAHSVSHSRKWKKASRKSRSYKKRSYSRKSKKSYRRSASTKRRGHKHASSRRASKRTYRKKSRSYSSYSPSKSLTGSKVRWVASSGCLSSQLRGVVYQVASKYGPVTVNSTCRSHKRNRAVGGAKRSKHLSGNAVDFRVHGNVSAVYAYLRSNGSVGGLKHYGGGLFHIDTGDRRSW